MFNYLQRARALAAAVRKLQTDVEQLRTALRETEQRCETLTERARLETVALNKRLEAESGKVEAAAISLFEQARQLRIVQDKQG